MSAATPQPTQDPWRDAHGTHISLFCLVEQAADDAEYTMVPSRLHQQGQIVGRDLDSLYVCFADNQVISLAPHLLRVLDECPSGG